jgi:hypothetical protein
MTEYGLPGHRDNDGNRKPVDYTFEWNGDDVSIRILPPTLSEMDYIEQLPEDVDPDTLRDAIIDILVEPELDDNPTTTEIFAYMVGIQQYAYSGGSPIAQEAREELDRRGDDAGN